MDFLFYVFSGLNILDFALELFLEKNLLKKHKKVVLLNFITRRKLSIFKQTLFTALLGLIVVGVSVVIFYFAFTKP